MTGRWVGGGGKVGSLCLLPILFTWLFPVRAHKCGINIFLDLGFLHFSVFSMKVLAVTWRRSLRPLQSLPVTHCRVPRTTKDSLAHRTEKSEVWWASELVWFSRLIESSRAQFLHLSSLCPLPCWHHTKAGCPLNSETAGNNFKGYMLPHLHLGNRGFLEEALLEQPLSGFLGPNWVACPSLSQ